MVRFMSYEDNYFKFCESYRYRTVIYGVGTYAKRAFPYLKNVAYICDRRAEEIKRQDGAAVITPAELEQKGETFAVVVCVKSKEKRNGIRDQLASLSMDAFVFDYFDNEAFDLYREKECVGVGQKRTLQNVRIICEDKGWIFQKFAQKMQQELEKMGYVCSVGHAPDPAADINHHVSYASCEPVVSDYNETFMITHIDTYNKAGFIKHQLKKARLGICMSRETMEKLAAYGIPREKLCYINPAQDGVIKPKKYVLGITQKTHGDHRKNENILVDLCRSLDPNYFLFKIMGSGWGEIVAAVRKLGFEVEYEDEFDYRKYKELMPSLDYYLFWGFDEGSMGFLDALRAGVETIVTPQGYHLDIKNGITFACRTLEDFKQTLLALQEKRKRRVESVGAWTWKHYVEKHLEVWNYLLGNEKDLFRNQHLYEDGIFSVWRDFV